MIRIKTLLGHSQIDTASLCLGSLYQQCRDSIAFIIHDDGTLTKEDKNKLDGLLMNPEYIDRDFADQRIFSLLEKFPACLQYRKNHVFGLKLFDVCLLHDKDETLYYFDSDILFLRPFQFPAIPTKNAAIFMQDVQQPFALRPWHLKPLGKLNVISRLNAGIMITHNSNLDLDYAESFLSDPTLQSTFAKKPQWIEQTCWASLATRLSTYLLDPSQVFMAHTKMGPATAENVAIHFIFTHRGKMHEYPGTSLENPNDVTTLRLKKAHNASVLDLFYGDIKSRLGFN